MNILQVYKFPHPLLKLKSRLVTRFDGRLKQLAQDMLATMYKERGVGLAAVQVGKPQRLLVMDLTNDLPREQGSTLRREPRIYVNPELLHTEGEITTREGCLSVEGYTTDIRRASRVIVRYQDTGGRLMKETLEGLAAVCLQHEMDHLEGRLFIDRLSPVKSRMVKKRLSRQARPA